MPLLGKKCVQSNARIEKKHDCITIYKAVFGEVPKSKVVDLINFVVADR